MNSFVDAVAESKAVLTEGGVVERVIRHSIVKFDPHIAHSGLIYDGESRLVLETIYREYIDIGKKRGLPFLNLAPTWRANPERIKNSVFRDKKNINRDCVDFLKEIRDSYNEYGKSIFIGGMMACKGDAYRPQEALCEEDARQFHREQAEALANSGVDFIKAATLPAASEARGIASTISALDIPYILSFVIRPEGTLLDGTPIDETIETIDSAIHPAPFFYMVNCVHPSVFQRAMAACPESARKRILGFQANTSEKNPEELDNLEYLDTFDPKDFAQMMLSIHERFGIKILGGCCGSDGTHIEEIAAGLSNKKRGPS